MFQHDWKCVLYQQLREKHAISWSNSSKSQNSSRHVWASAIDERKPSTRLDAFVVQATFRRRLLIFSAISFCFRLATQYRTDNATRLVRPEHIGIQPITRLQPGQHCGQRRKEMASSDRLWCLGSIEPYRRTDHTTTDRHGTDGHKPRTRSRDEISSDVRRPSGLDRFERHVWLEQLALLQN